MGPNCLLSARSTKFPILVDPGAVSRVGRKGGTRYLRTFVPPFLSTRLTASGSPRMQISRNDRTNHGYWYVIWCHHKVFSVKAVFFSDFCHFLAGRHFDRKYTKFSIRKLFDDELICDMAPSQIFPVNWFLEWLLNWPPFWLEVNIN